MARAIHQYGLNATQLWLNGNERTHARSQQDLDAGVYFATHHVPFTAPTRLYPGLTLYLKQMKKYEPKYVYNELVIQGWESAALFVQGVRAVGHSLTWANVIKQTNKLTAFTAGGLTAPVNWAIGGHRSHAPPTAWPMSWPRAPSMSRCFTRGRTSSTASTPRAQRRIQCSQSQPGHQRRTSRALGSNTFRFPFLGTQASEAEPYRQSQERPMAEPGVGLPRCVSKVLPASPVVAGNLLRLESIGNRNPDPNRRRLVAPGFTLWASNHPAPIAAPENLRVVCHPHVASRHVPILEAIPVSWALALRREPGRPGGRPASLHLLRTLDRQLRRQEGMRRVNPAAQGA